MNMFNKAWTLTFFKYKDDAQLPIAKMVTDVEFP